ncbi:MAG TPA: hypothetical protein VIR57_19175 [Chloroflexota bacterium]|jgi:hypothetical protein
MAAPRIEERQQALLRQERLLLEAIESGDLQGQQWRVQTSLLRQTRGELAVAEREVRAVEAGWEPFEPSVEWSRGYVEDPRFLRGRVKTASALMALPLAALGGVVLAMHWDLLPACLLTVVLFLGLQVALHGVLGRVAQERDSRRLGEEAEPRMFNAPMPAHAATAYRRARESGLFDTFVVHSPRAQDFRAVTVAEAPSLGLLDPVLAGRIGRHSFLIAQWDLAKDLAEV